MESILVYRGPSRFVSAQGIAGVVSAKSDNTKTGNLATLWVLPDRTLDPRDAVRDGRDACVCGNCESRKGGAGPRCYAHGQTLYNGGMSMWRGLDRRLDATAWALPELVAWLRVVRQMGARGFRSAAYGDIAALPVSVQLHLHAAVKQAGLGPRGYTHQWADPEVQHLRAWHMASVSTAQQAAQAQALGWRVYWAQPAGQPVPPGLLLCPASKEAGRLTTCSECTLCSGLVRGTAPSVYIPDHGPMAQGARVAAAALARRAARTATAAPPVLLGETW